jgi:hypothetical protein
LRSQRDRLDRESGLQNFQDRYFALKLGIT